MIGEVLLAISLHSAFAWVGRIFLGFSNGLMLQAVYLEVIVLVVLCYVLCVVFGGCRPCCPFKQTDAAGSLP